MYASEAMVWMASFAAKEGGAGVYPFWPEVAVQAGLAVDAAGVARAVHAHSAPEELPVDV